MTVVFHIPIKSDERQHIIIINSEGPTSFNLQNVILTLTISTSYFVFHFFKRVFFFFNLI